MGNPRKLGFLTNEEAAPSASPPLEQGNITPLTEGGDTLTATFKWREWEIELCIQVDSPADAISRLRQYGDLFGEAS